MADITQDTIVVDWNGKSYTFRVPSIMFDIEMGTRILDIRRRAAPNSLMYAAMDLTAAQFLRYLALFELYLLSATTAWPYGYAEDDIAKIDMTKPPVVDSTKFPTNKYRTILAVGQTFETEYDRFRDDGDTDIRPAGT